MKISIVTATFNSSMTLEDTIKSVLSQTYPDIEYIIVDGASKDGTMDIVRKYEPMFKGRMKWVSEKDRGIYDALNKGIKMATGEVVGFLNSDDFFRLDDAIERVAKEFDANPDLGCTFADLCFVDHDDTLVDTNDTSYKLLLNYIANKTNKILTNYCTNNKNNCYICVAEKTKTL